MEIHIEIVGLKGGKKKGRGREEKIKWRGFGVVR